MDHMFRYLLDEGKEYTGSSSSVSLVRCRSRIWGKSRREAKFKEYLVRYLVKQDIDWAVWCLRESYLLNTVAVEANKSYEILNQN